MRKILISEKLSTQSNPPACARCLDLESLAEVALTSEAAGYTIESALLKNTDSRSGWRAATPGKQQIRIMFDQPVAIQRIDLSFNEPEYSRTQEFVLRWTGDNGIVQEILRQQYHFSPPNTSCEIETYTVNLSQLKVLELIINPDINNNNAFASLQQLSLWQNDARC
jgi:hypothetical protein